MGPLSRPYLCTVAEQPVRGLVSIDNVIGKHEGSKSNDDVAVVSVKNINCDRLPSGLEKYFRNLQGIFAFSSQKKELLRDDLERFPKLKYLDISMNYIQKLPSDVFEGNPQIEWIDISDNRLKLVGLDVLNGLRKLHYANFQQNLCIDELANDRTDLERTLKKRLVLMCQPVGGQYTGTTESPDGRPRVTTPSSSEEDETTKKGFWKKIFG